MTAMLKVTFLNEWEVLQGFRLAYLLLTLAHSKGQVRDNKYIENGERYGQNYYCNQIASPVWSFDWHLALALALAHSENQGHAYSTTNIFEMMTG